MKGIDVFVKIKILRSARGKLIALKKWKVVAAGNLKNGKSKQKAKK